MTGETLTPWMEDKLGDLLRFAKKNGISARVVSTRRSCADQNAIYESGPGVVTQARGCQSWHVWGRAADLQIDGPADEYAILGAKWKSWGGVWGGDFAFHDLGHFEWHPGLKIEDVCPSQDFCPNPNVPWAEDRPLLSRPGVRFVGGALLVGIGVTLARRVLSK